ncbi:hypothetical protein THAOC_27942 [Thalassiosira oceanica]|uniref:Uncharacterized protein n=1 Tax=Thalassiosira oceanica TaxID=159749 RepID=K0S1M0_THAOC|nr:hypothetical protein THAOC_27942 [Thalassiosira oceanica]|eukprot:EJK52757.1 hypothetical protein THAOC_27942 [Thalassiosira oceanica]
MPGKDGGGAAGQTWSWRSPRASPEDESFPGEGRLCPPVLLWWRTPSVVRGTPDEDASELEDRVPTTKVFSTGRRRGCDNQQSEMGRENTSTRRGRRLPIFAYQRGLTPGRQSIEKIEVDLDAGRKSSPCASTIIETGHTKLFNLYQARVNYQRTLPFHLSPWVSEMGPQWGRLHKVGDPSVSSAVQRARVLGRHVEGRARPCGMAHPVIPTLLLESPPLV